MPAISISASATIRAPASLLYEIIADYSVGHPSILPPQYFGHLNVLAGGRGAGTRIRFEIKAFGRTNVGVAEISEPTPSRELRETLSDGIVTSFLVQTVEPAAALRFQRHIRKTDCADGWRNCSPRGFCAESIQQNWLSSRV